MEQEVIFLQMILFILCGLTGIAILIFILRKNQQDIDYNKYIVMMKEQTEFNLETLNKGNKKIDDLEEKILNCKRKLRMKLFYNKKS